MEPVKKARRLVLWNRLMLRLSVSRRIDGLWVGTLEGRGKAETVFRRVEEALRLIKTYDRRRYDRLRCDLERVWVLVLPGVLGAYNERLRACQLDSRHVLARDSSPELIAATIVHEATHARLRRCGIGYDEGLRARVEAICFRRELAFAAKLPNGQHVRESVERSLEAYASPSNWTDMTLSDRYVEGAKDALRYLGMPTWSVRVVLALRALHPSARRHARAKTGAAEE